MITSWVETSCDVLCTFFNKQHTWVAFCRLFYFTNKIQPLLLSLEEEFVIMFQSLPQLSPQYLNVIFTAEAKLKMDDGSISHICVFCIRSTVGKEVTVLRELVIISFFKSYIAVLSFSFFIFPKAAN